MICEDIICFSHLRWNFVYQRPQHLLTRFSKYARVIFFEEPVFDAQKDYYETIKDVEHNVLVVVPHLEANLNFDEIARRQKALLDSMFHALIINQYLLWYYSPMALAFTEHLKPIATVYDCMDELAGFKFAPPALVEFEANLFEKADIVFTGGYSLFEAKKNRHKNIYPCPSSIDRNHFFSARGVVDEPNDQKEIPHPRLGFYGVIDERLNLELVNEMASLKPDWHFIYIGPIVKIDPNSLPKRSNIHYLGGKDYQVLPAYLAGWDIAIMPFALNESTKYISPTKTPEYLCGGKPVISTSIRDVIRPYAEEGLVHIADTGLEFIEVAEKILNHHDSQWLSKVDDYLVGISWDKTWINMEKLILDTISKKINNTLNAEIYV